MGTRDESSSSIANNLDRLREKVQKDNLAVRLVDAQNGAKPGTEAVAAEAGHRRPAGRAEEEVCRDCRSPRLKSRASGRSGLNPRSSYFPLNRSRVGAQQSRADQPRRGVRVLLTGQIVRRELLASSQDEFAGALRNAHIPDGTSVFVQTEVVGSDGKSTRSGVP